MRFPDPPRKGEGAHAAAMRRLDAARSHVKQLVGEAETARGTRAETRTLRELGAAHDQVTARQAWVDWIEAGALG
jgi:hypothetical protein